MPIEIKRPTRTRRPAGLLLGVGLAVSVIAGLGLVVFLGDRVVASKADPVPVAKFPWEVAVDPGPDWGKFSVPDNATIRTSSTNVVYPTTPAPFVAVHPAGDPRAWQVYDLRTWQRVGAPQKLDLPLVALPVLSPEGRFLAFKGSSEGSPIEVCPVDDPGLRIKSEPAPGMVHAVVDFAGKDRILIGSARGSVYEDIPGDWDVMDSAKPPFLCPYQVLEGPGPTSIRVLVFSAPLLHAIRAGLSPGRNSMVIHQFDEAKGHQLVFRDLRTGKEAGALPVQDADNPRGHPAGLAFSRDGKQLALLWRLNDRSERWGVLMCWDVATGRKILEHDVGYLVSSMELLWTHGGARSIQWLPDGSGWLIFGHLVLRREDGAVIHKIGPEPKSASEVVERLFLTPDRYTHFDRATKTLSIRTLK